MTIGGADRQLSSRFEGAGEEPQLGVAGERVEVPVGVEQVEVGSDGHRSDEAVGERSSRVAGSTALPVDRGGALEIVEAPRRHELAPSKQLPQPIRMGVVPSAGEHLHHDERAIARGGVQVPASVPVAWSSDAGT